MISILEKINSTPSTAIKFAIDGIKRLSQRDDYIIDMASYGGVNKQNICYGCAATAAIQEIARKDLTIDDISLLSLRAEVLDLEVHELMRFEDCIDNARRGFLVTLGEFCGVDLKTENRKLQEDIEYMNHRQSDEYIDSIETLQIVYPILIKAGK